MVAPGKALQQLSRIFSEPVQRPVCSLELAKHCLVAGLSSAQCLQLVILPSPLSIADVWGQMGPAWHLNRRILPLQQGENNTAHGFALLGSHSELHCYISENPCPLTLCRNASVGSAMDLLLALHLQHHLPVLNFDKVPYSLSMLVHAPSKSFTLCSPRAHASLL